MTTTPIEHSDPTAVHRRALRLHIILPVVLVIVLIAALMLTLTPLPPRGVSLIADLFMILLCLIPMIVCLLPLYILMIVAVVLMGRAGGATTRQVRRLRVMTGNLSEQTRATSDNINRKTINASARIAPLDRLFSLFDRPEKTE